MNTERLVNLSAVQRIARIVVGMGLTTSVIAMSGPLGWMAVLPLLGIYPSLTAFTGYDPVYAAMEETGYGPLQAMPA